MGKIRTADLRQPEQELLIAQAHAKAVLKSKQYPDLYAYNNYGEQFPYEGLLYDTLMNGTPKFDRTGVLTISVHGRQARFNLDNGFPLITTKKVFLKGVIHELLWLLRGETNIKYLVENDVSIWSDWPLKYYNQKNETNLSIKEFHEKILNEQGFAEKWGELGPVYGKQWRNWEKAAPWENDGNWIHRTVRIDQIQQIVDMINKQHETGIISRRMLVTAWNPADLEEMAKSGLPPCHCLFQFHSRLMTLVERQKYWAKVNQKDFSYTQNMTDDMLDEAGAPVYELDLQLYQRSCDSFLGVSFNIASYALMCMMIAQVTNTKPGTFIHDYGDFHIYKNHLDKVVEQLSRDARPYPIMTLKNRGQKIDEFVYDDFVLSNYNPHPAISADVAV